MKFAFSNVSILVLLGSTAQVIAAPLSIASPDNQDASLDRLSVPGVENVQKRGAPALGKLMGSLKGSAKPLARSKSSPNSLKGGAHGEHGAAPAKAPGGNIAQPGRSASTVHEPANGAAKNAGSAENAVQQAPGKQSKLHTLGDWLVPAAVSGGTMAGMGALVSKFQGGSEDSEQAPPADQQAAPADPAAAQDPAALDPAANPQLFADPSLADLQAAGQ